MVAIFRLIFIFTESTCLKLLAHKIWLHYLLPVKSYFYHKNVLKNSQGILKKLLVSCAENSINVCKVSVENKNLFKNLAGWNLE